MAWWLFGYRAVEEHQVVIVAKTGAGERRTGMVDGAQVQVRKRPGRVSDQDCRLMPFHLEVVVEEHQVVIIAAETGAGEGRTGVIQGAQGQIRGGWGLV